MSQLFEDLPQDWKAFSHWTWEETQPFADDLLGRRLTPESVETWMLDWSSLMCLITEVYNRLHIHTTAHTDDADGHARFRAYTQDFMPKARAFEQAMKVKLIDSGLEPAGMRVPLKRMRSDAAIYREENLAIQAEIEELSSELMAITGGIAFRWDGQDLTRAQVAAKLAGPDRQERERAWKCMAGAHQDVAGRMDAIWARMVSLRGQMAHNAGFDSYRDYRWQELARFDYSPADVKTFQDAIEQVVVPACNRLAERRRKTMGVDRLRVWDDYWHLQPDLYGRPPLQPFRTVEELNQGMVGIFTRLDPELGAEYQALWDEGLLDLDNRPNKAAVGYMEQLPVSKKPFIFQGVVGGHQDVTVQLHESGHAFHYLECCHLPYFYQFADAYGPIEFAEVASMGMELLASPYLGLEDGGFYTPEELAQERSGHLSSIIRIWPYIAVVDAFQQWAYGHPDEATETDRMDDVWAELIQRFLPQLDWTGNEETLRVSWRLQAHIFHWPLYYVEYGIAQLGAVQLWANALKDPQAALADYRHALSLGNTASLPELYRAAGIEFRFDADTFGRAIDLIEHTMDELNPS